MSTYTIDRDNPALEVETLIKEFDWILGASGVIRTAELIQDFQSQNHDHLPDYLSEVDALTKLNVGKAVRYYDKLIEITAEIIAHVDEDVYFYHVETPNIPDIGEDDAENIQGLIKYVVQTRHAVQPLIDDVATYSKKYQLLSEIENKKKILGKGFYFQFGDREFNRLKELFGEILDLIEASKVMEDAHRKRLIKRIETVNDSVHRKLSDLDKLWGLVSEVSILNEKYHKEAQDIVAKIGEVLQIAWKIQIKAEALPVDTHNPLLSLITANQ